MKNFKLLLLLCSFGFCANLAYSQEKDSLNEGIVVIEPATSQEYIIVEEQPKQLNLDEVRKKIGYPEKAQKAKIEGLIIARVLVDKEGKYKKHKVVRSAHLILQEAVEKYLPELRFEPAMQGGKPIAFWVNIPFRFKLDSKVGQGRSAVFKSEISLKNLKGDAKVSNDPSPTAFIKVDVQPKVLNLAKIQKEIGYPKEAAKANIEGLIVAQVLVGEEGEYLKHLISKKGYKVLQDPVEKYLKDLKFTPAMQDGKPIKFWINIPFRFRLQ